MTPKEKAQELVKNYWDVVFDFGLFDYGKSRTVKCAIIMVKEILTNFEGLHKPEYCAFDAIGDRKFTFEGEYETHMTGYDMVEYWNEVLNELNKMQ